MCGIAGMVSSHKTEGLLQQIKAATQTLSHRGPQYEQYWQSDNVGVVLGHKRLCIIDVDQRSNQPFHYLNRYHVIHNGELYNYLEIKKNLQDKGYYFSTESDTEVIVAAYDAYKKDCLQSFDGMFAFAIWDEQEQMLFAARDRFGEKPFFFFYNEEKLLFASEIKALWAAGVEKQVNESMLYNYLTIGYTANPFNPQETFYQDIWKLPAASFLEYKPASHELSIEKYWTPYIDENKNISADEALEQFKALFKESIRKRLRSDVAVGTSLSGGLDSSSIVAMCSQQASQNYTHKCFTVGFPGFDKSEEQYASLVAKQFGLNHHLVNIDESALLQDLDKIMWHQEEPVNSSSVLAQYKVYQAAKQNGVTVLLDGQGADEILAGYHKYYKWQWQQLYAEKKLKKSGELAAAQALGVQEKFGLKNKAMAMLPHFSMAMLQSRKEKEAAKQGNLNKEFISLHKKNLYYATPSESTLNSALYFNTFVYGLEELLRYADRNSMAHAVEVRLPFLNHQLVEFLFTLPAHLKIKEGWTKWLLRKAMEDILPKEIAWRKDKVGFEPPQKQWMQNVQVQDKIQASKKILVEKNILSSAVLNKPIRPADANAAKSNDWRYWSASYLFAPIFAPIP
jgi:asparagine synthase (glutamine-hydrolysing)